MPPPASTPRKMTAGERAEAVKHLGLARLVASRSHVPLDGDERFSVALEAICRAVGKFDPGRNIKITTYLSATIQHELNRARIRQRLIRVPDYLCENKPRRADLATRAAGVASVRSLESDEMGTRQPESPDPDAEDRDREERAEWLRSALSKLPDRLREMVELRMGGATLREAGAAVGVGRDAARSLEKEAHAMLRAILSE